VGEEEEEEANRYEPHPRWHRPRPLACAQVEGERKGGMRMEHNMAHSPAGCGTRTSSSLSHETTAERWASSGYEICTLGLRVFTFDAVWRSYLPVWRMLSQNRVEDAEWGSHQHCLIGKWPHHNKKLPGGTGHTYIEREPRRH
jgi:hypothetical protein